MKTSAILVVLFTLFPQQLIAQHSVVFWDGRGQISPTADVRYSGPAQVVAMAPHSNGVLSAFAVSGANYQVHWSRDGKNLWSGDIRYNGPDAISAMIKYKDGVLTAFAPTSGKYYVTWSSDGRNLGSGENRYSGGSFVEEMLEFNEGVLTAFSKVKGKGNRIHWSSNGTNLGGGKDRYDGTSPVEAMLAYHGGVLTAFSKAHAGGIRTFRKERGHRIHFSSNGEDLGHGTINYDGSSPVRAMCAFSGGVLTAFTKAEGRERIHLSPDGSDLGHHEMKYDGLSPISEMTLYGNGVLIAFENAPTAARPSTPTGPPNTSRKPRLSRGEPGPVMTLENKSWNEVRIEIRFGNVSCDDCFFFREMVLRKNESVKVPTQKTDTKVCYRRDVRPDDPADNAWTNWTEIPVHSSPKTTSIN